MAKNMIISPLERAGRVLYTIVVPWEERDNIVAHEKWNSCHLEGVSQLIVLKKSISLVALPNVD